MEPPGEFAVHFTTYDFPALSPVIVARIVVQLTVAVTASVADDVP